MMARRLSQHPAARRAFTLIEMVATMVILGAIGTIASNIMFTCSDGYIQAATSAQMHTEASIGMDRMVRELRKIELDDGASGIAPNIDSLTPTSLAWHGTSSLTLLGSNLMFVDDGADPAVLLSDVSSLFIQAFDEGNASMSATLSGSACDDIRRLSISLSLQRAGVTETLRTKVFLRATMAGTGGGS